MTEALDEKLNEPLGMSTFSAQVQKQLITSQFRHTSQSQHFAPDFETKEPRGFSLTDTSSSLSDATGFD